MAQKIFKGFMQVTEGTFAAENGYIYFVRKSSNTGATDGYLQFNGKKYGTAAELESELSADLSELSAVTAEIYSDYLKAADKTELNNAITAETSARESADEALSGRLDTLEAVDADSRIEALEAASADTRLDALEALSAGTRIGALEAASADTRLDALEALSAGTRLDALEALSAGTRLDAIEAVDADSRLDALEAISADTRISDLEDSAHTHDNKAVLDGITQAKVDSWDSIAGGAEVVLSAYTAEGQVTDGFLKTYEIFQGGVSKGKIDIPKDMVVTSGQIVEESGVKYLRLTIANQVAPVDIAVTDLVDVYTPGDGIEISNSNEISAKVVEANGLSVDASGITMALADGSNAGAMSAADFTKLGTIDASAQTNVIETVKVDGTALTVTDKAVDIVLPDYTNTYAPKSLTGTVETNRTDFDNYTAATDDSIAALSAVSADTRIDALEAASADTRLDALEALTASTESAVQGVQLNGTDIALDANKKANVVLPTATVTGTSNGVTVEVVETEGELTEVNVTAPDFASTYAAKNTYDAYTAATDGRLDTIESGYTQNATYDAYTAATDGRLDALEAVDADSRLDALEALTASTDSALQSISAGDASVTVGTKANNNQTVAVAVSSDSDNALSLKNDGLFAAIYYDGNDSD
ncbi:MAG: hypothetical protein J6X18_17095 [Bacteroidales bacterium]|nr:hypothetical protein [Bacteroidales bacterium]